MKCQSCEHKVILPEVYCDGCKRKLQAVNNRIKKIIGLERVAEAVK